MDKQDELARVIGDACWEKWGDGPWGAATEQVECQAAAVRSFMGSDEVVERVARAIADDLKGRAVYVSDDLRNCLVDGGLFDLHDPARAALSAAIGEEVGVGKSEGGEPTGNSLS